MTKRPKNTIHVNTNCHFKSLKYCVMLEIGRRWLVSLTLRHSHYLRTIFLHLMVPFYHLIFANFTHHLYFTLYNISSLLLPSPHSFINAHSQENHQFQTIYLAIKLIFCANRIITVKVTILKILCTTSYCS